MKERTALIIAFATAAVVPVTVLVVLAKLGASSRLLAFAYFFLLCFVADSGVRVVLRYRR
jgi:hypothetical protein